MAWLIIPTKEKESEKKRKENMIAQFKINILYLLSQSQKWIIILFYYCNLAKIFLFK